MYQPVDTRGERSTLSSKARRVCLKMTLAFLTMYYSITSFVFGILYFNFLSCEAESESDSATCFDPDNMLARNLTLVALSNGTLTTSEAVGCDGTTRVFVLLAASVNLALGMTAVLMLGAMVNTKRLKPKVPIVASCIYLFFMLGYFGFGVQNLYFSGCTFPSLTNLFQLHLVLFFGPMLLFGLQMCVVVAMLMSDDCIRHCLAHGSDLEDDSDSGSDSDSDCDGSTELSTVRRSKL